MRIAILTNFKAWNDSYSLTHVVHAQALTLAKYGHEVTVFTLEGSGLPEQNELPFYYDCWPCLAKDADTDSKTLSAILPSFDAVFTHDWILNAGNALLRDSLVKSQEALKDIPFLHWLHSAPNFGPFDFWDINLYGPKHKIVYPVHCDLQRVADKFKARRDQVRHIPHIVDLRILNDWHPDTWRVVDELPGLMSADYVQVYPSERWRMGGSGKRVDKLILFFKTLKEAGADVCLLIVDSWSGFGESGDISEYRSIALRNDLSPHECAFSSTLLDGMFPDGLTRRILRELYQLSSVFVYPTHGESFGLPLPETVLCGGALPVFNSSLSVLDEVSGGFGAQCEFGSCEKGVQNPNERERLTQAVLELQAASMASESWKSRVWARQQFNMDRVYRDFYAPILREVTA